HDAADGLTEIRLGGERALLPAFEAEPGERVRIRVSAQDVILSRTRPEGLSALNVLPARVTEISEDADGVGVGLAIGTDRLLARITARSLRTLGLRPGDTCYAIIKASGVERRDVAHPG
ncbi:MAG: TOBE domain-containing protein, partial [Pseudomonadota bacterium]